MSSTPLTGRNAITAAAISLALSLAVYWPAVNASFVSDDINAIAANEYVVGPAGPVAIFTEFSWWGASRADAPGYRPLVTWTFAANHALGGVSPVGYHIVNIALHAIVSWLVLVVGLGVGLTLAQAGAAAVLFCILPVHVEPVAWAVGRAELMAAALFCTTLLALLAYRRRGRPAALALACASLVLGMFSKENVVTVLAAPPLMAWLLPSTRASRRRDAKATAWMLAALACYLALRTAAGPVLPGSPGDQLDNPLSVLPLHSRLLGAVSVLGRYLALTVWPHPLSIDYSYNALGIEAGFAGDRYTIIGLAACAALALAAWRTRRRLPAIAFAIALAAASYSIVSNTIVLIGTVMGERLFYLPSLGLCLAAGPAIAAAGGAAGRKGWIAVAAVGLAFAVTSGARAVQWRTPGSVFESAARAQPRSARVHMELGSALGATGDVDGAIAAFERSLAIMPGYAAAWYNLGNLHARRGNYDEGVRAYEEAVAHNPNLIRAWYNLALTERLRGNGDAALAAVGEAAARATHDPASATLEAEVLLALGRNAEAADAYDRAIELNPTDPALYINRGVARQRTAGCAAAVDDYIAAVRMTGGHRSALSNAVGCLEALGRGGEATELRASVANRPSGR